MRRIKPSENSLPDPVTGKDSFKTPNPPDPNSILTPALLNIWQEEMANVIESGGATLNEADNFQLLKAVKFPAQITANVTIGAGLADLAAALEYLRGRYVAPGVTVTIAHNLLTSKTVTAPILIDHPQSNQFILKGNNATNPLKIDMTNASILASGSRLFSVKPGCTLRMETLNIEPLAGGINSKEVDVIYSPVGGRMSLTTVNIERFLGNIVNADGGKITCDTVVTKDTGPYSDSFDNALSESGYGFLAKNNGHIIAKAINSTGSSAGSALALNGGVIEIRDSVFTEAGVVAARGGTIRAYNTRVYGASTVAAFQAIDGGVLIANTCQTGTVNVGGTTGPNYGFSAIQGGYIFAIGSTADRCQTSSFFASINGVMNIESCTAANKKLHASKNGKISAALSTIVIPSGNSDAAAVYAEVNADIFIRNSNVSMGSAINAMFADRQSRIGAQNTGITYSGNSSSNQALVSNAGSAVSHEGGTITLGGASGKSGVATKGSNIGIGSATSVSGGAGTTTDASSNIYVA